MEGAVFIAAGANGNGFKGYELEAGAYADNDKDGPFSDFYSDLSSYTYRRELAERVGDVSIRDKFEKIDLITLPANGVLTVGF